MIPLRDSVPARRTPWMMRAILAANVGAFFLQLTDMPTFTETWQLVPAEIVAWWRSLLTGSVADRSFEVLAPLLTAQFLHGSLLHIGSNLLFLSIFADNVEGEWGSLRFLAFYLFCGVVASVTHVAIVGAESPPLAGTLGAYFVLFPHSRVLTLIPLGFIPLFLEIPAAVFLLLWFALQVFLGLIDAGGHVAVWAHAGGFVAGAVIARATTRRGRNSGRGPRYDVLPPHMRPRGHRAPPRARDERHLR